jgi:TonB family protein
MSVAAGMMPEWKQWEGDIVDGEFPLEQFLGAGEQGAVFRTRLPSGDGAIKLVPAGDVQAAHLVGLWNQARTLEHPHLIRIVNTGIWAKGGMPLAYLVMEYADENLEAVLVQRALTGEETLEMLQPVAQALAFLHQQGFVHGRLKPSNILAVNDTLKISSDAVSLGDASGDLRELTATMVLALTQQPAKLQENEFPANVIDSLPEPFREIARACTGQNGHVTWSAAELAGWLQSRTVEPSAATARPARGSPSKTRRTILTYCVIAFALILVGVVSVGRLLRHRIADPVAAVPPPSTKPPEQTPSTSLPTPPPKQEPTAKEVVEPPAPARQPRPRRALDQQEQVARQVLPDIPAKARRTVSGRTTVTVRVTVDQSGQVTDASLQPGGSPYFGKLALAAARNWRFVAGSSAAPQEWLLRFEITRKDTKVFPEKSATP